MDALSQLALAGGLAWASGIRLYVTILVVGLLGRLGYLHLPEQLLVLQHTWVLAAAAIMAVGEFLADKIPAFDSFWDALHTFIRIPAGAFLAWGAMGDATPAAQLAAGLIGGLVTSGTHLAKSGGRAAINTSPEPFTNWTASAGEDGLVLGGLWLAIAHPIAFLVALVLFLALVAWLLPKLFRFVQRMLRRLLGRGAPAAQGGAFDAAVSAAGDSRRA
ncbi:DUF4126 domain-containing protein [Dokdonella fugitiva]|jgi:hypothetical protein|uniref:Uncharacterized protein DUF4126 n=1 Tax=Dokdonella fugitiva TaxID=328517 RepID=A0A4R2IGQ0_9GAMM|nr:DUF4126 domain-containing protein [Dokdonella fugitiva]MBA8882627.1 hypothetical protein [Dokdonella fugitiva]TCO43396.1 uncharacterized protein DUF4126 [Dokdonella fugitiva]